MFDRGIAALGDLDTVTVTAATEAGLTCSLVASRRSAYGFEQRTEVFWALGMLAVEPQRRSLLGGMNAAGGFADRYVDFFPARYADAYRAELAPQLHIQFQM